MAKKPKKKIPIKKPEEFSLPYSELVGEWPNWEAVFETKGARDKARKYPNDQTLTFAFLTRIVELLSDIKHELKRDRKIS